MTRWWSWPSSSVSTTARIFWICNCFLIGKSPDSLSKGSRMFNPAPKGYMQTCRYRLQLRSRSLFYVAKRCKQIGRRKLMTSDNICDILVSEKKQQSIQHTKSLFNNKWIRFSNAASLIWLAAFLRIPSATQEMLRIILFWEVFALCDEKCSSAPNWNVVNI